jgi:uncharacterized protein
VTVFADSSALVKLYADEIGSADIRALGGIFFVSALARVEIPAALWRKQRTGELSREDSSTLAARFGADFHGTPHEPPGFISIAVTARVLDLAAGLTEIHGLRAYDAVQLASALTVRTVESSCDTFACFDRGLAAAARAEKFIVHPYD